MSTPSSIGAMIRAIRLGKSWSQAMLAHKAKIKIITLRDIESGKRKAHFQTLQKIVQALDISEEDLTKPYQSQEVDRLSASVKLNAELKVPRVETMEPFKIIHTDVSSRPRAKHKLAISENSGGALRRPTTAEAIREHLVRKHLQVALDVTDARKALDLAAIAEAAAVDLLEIGDPLIKRFGMNIVGDIRAVCPDTPIVVEFSSSDWIDDQIQMACDSGTDIVQIIGLTNETRLKKAVQCARKFDIGIFAAIPADRDAAQWCTIAQEAGIDGISIIRNIDCFQSSEQILKDLDGLYTDIHRPVLISGGFTPRQIADMVDLPWNVAIVGSAIVNAQSPRQIIEEILQIIGKTKKGDYGQDHSLNIRKRRSPNS